MTRVAFKVDSRELVEWAQIYERFGKEAGEKVATRALNHTGAMAFTRVRRTLAKQTGLAYAETTKAVRSYNATFANLEYLIIGTGSHLSLRSFSPEQRRTGVSARPWGKRRTFRGTFIIDKLNGQVFKRVYGEYTRYRVGTTKRGKPIMKKGEKIRKLWGPSIPVELLRDDVPRVFEEVIRENLSKRVEHELNRLFIENLKRR